MTETVWRSQNLLYRRLDTLSLRFAQLIEGYDARAVPVLSCFPMGVNGKGEVVGYVNQIRMGELTGMGTIGRNGLLIHPLHGARMMLGGVLTTIELPIVRSPDIEEPGCPPRCRMCIDSCPAHAISDHAGRVDIMRCLTYAARTPFLPRLRFMLMRRHYPAAAARLMNLRAFDEHTMHICSRCITVCPYGKQPIIKPQGGPS
jgi:epoxyqueuosine reductase QueG